MHFPEIDKSLYSNGRYMLSVKFPLSLLSFCKRKADRR
jgi:hypothetical protein